MANTQRLLTIDEARAFLKVGKNTMYGLVREGLPAIRIGKQIRIPEESLSRWIDVMAFGEPIKD
ncbi:helix-turn-helix domain-containing protein [Paenibacillus sp. MCAF9]|uniref:helix-turn-helix domain-containing protein n=1 Tax=Paenibacillus sp. MCAF9 TaxID=3233046 RepID=UPI003F948ABC